MRQRTFLLAFAAGPSSVTSSEVAQQRRCPPCGEEHYRPRGRYKHHSAPAFCEGFGEEEGGRGERPEGGNRASRPDDCQQREPEPY